MRRTTTARYGCELGASDRRLQRPAGRCQPSPWVLVPRYELIWRPLSRKGVRRCMSDVDTVQIAREAIADISARFPTLRMVENPKDPVELSVTLPVQPGLKQQVWLCLQNIDELHFS